jgi:hypothetical protein
MRRSVGCRRQEVALRTAIVVREGWTEGSEPYVSSALQDAAIMYCSFPRPPEDPESRPPPQSGSDEGDTNKAWHRIASSLGDGPPSGEGEVRVVCRNILHSPHAAAACPRRRDFLRDYTEINKISWRWAATLGSIVYINNSRVPNLCLSCLELVLK